MNTIRETLAKIEGTPMPQVRHCAVAYSGGLDSTLGIELLRRIYRAERITAINVDVGQGEAEMAMARRRSAALGIEPLRVDARALFASEWLAPAIRANSNYWGYPVSTSMTRQLIAREVARLALELGCDSILEGSTGRGNDQFRMHNVFSLFAPGLSVLVPVRDFDLTRSEELELCRHWEVPVEEVISGGDDKTLWCRSIASGAVALNQEIPDHLWMWYVPPERAPEAARDVELEYEQGLPVRLDGEALPLAEIIERLNLLAGAHGIGRIDFFEDGIMGLKSREVYEAPAATVILSLKADLEGQCLTKEEREFKHLVDNRWASMVYHGEWFHPLKEELDAFVEASQRFVNGRLVARLYKGTVRIVERERSWSSLFCPEIRSIEASGFDQRWSRDAARIRGLPFEVLARRAGKVEVGV
ncbi:MAG: argininosuccinate synthase [Spirochaetales bacterium]|nr:argininosuccinate synthase [Spirochaetales bacterium]